MKEVDAYINSVFRCVKSNNSEIKELKEEMKNHLVDKINELMQEGKSESESIYEAIEEFDRNNELKSEIQNVYKTKRNNTRIIAVAAVLLFFPCIIIYCFLGLYTIKKSSYSTKEIVIKDTPALVNSAYSAFDFNLKLSNTTPPSDMLIPDRIVFYCSHPYETFANPSFKVTDAAKEINNSIVFNKLTSTYLENSNSDRPASYNVTRSLIEKNISEYKNCLLLDLHSTNVPFNYYDDGISIIVSALGPYSDNNEKLAKLLEKEIKSLHPSVSVKVYLAGRGIYNQDLSKTSLIINMGRSDTKAELIENNIRALSDALINLETSR
jgi:hypothetical protein